MVLLSFNACVTPEVDVGKTTSPVNVGEAKFAFKSSAACCIILTGLFKSEVLSMLPSPKLVLAAVAEFAPVPPFASATIPETLVAFPVKAPITLPERLPVTLPVTLPIRFPLKVFAVMVLPEKSPMGLLRTI